MLAHMPHSDKYDRLSRATTYYPLTSPHHPKCWRSPRKTYMEIGLLMERDSVLLPADKLIMPNTRRAFGGCHHTQPLWTPSVSSKIGGQSPRKTLNVWLSSHYIPCIRITTKCTVCYRYRNTKYDICAKCLPPSNCPGQRLNTVSASARKPFFCSRLPLYTSPRPCCIARSLRRSDFNVITGVPPPVTGRYTVPGSRKPLFPYNTITSSCDHTLYW